MLCGLLLSLCLILSACGETGGVTVSLYDGDTLVKDVTVTIGEQYDFGMPEKTGYSFLGWYSAKEGGSAYTDAQGLSAGMTWQDGNSKSVYAHWQANQYKLTFNYCDATASNSVVDASVTYDAEIDAKFPVPEKTGFSFLGWYTEKTNGVQITDSLGQLTENAKVYNNSVYPLEETGTTLYAHWGERMITYQFVVDGEAVETKSWAVGSVLTELPINTKNIKDNECFAAWCFDSACVSEMTLPYTVPNSKENVITLYAKFVPGTVDILIFNTIPSTGDREYEVSYSGDAEVLVIPDSYFGKKVTRVCSIQSATVKEIVLPQTVKSFVNGAFEGCVSLEKINIPYSVESLPDRVFLGCAALKEINIPQKVKSIGKQAFSGCASIRSVSIPAGVATIGEGAFRNTLSLTEIKVDEGNERYMALDGVLYYSVGSSTYLVQYPAAKSGTTYRIDPSTVKIMEYAFSGAGISTISIGDKISSIENGAFENCKNLVSVSISGSSIAFTIGEGAFANCANLKAMKIELSKVPTLKATAFEGVADTFSVYVASNMIRNYQTSTNWREISEQIYSLGTIFGDFAIEEVDGGYTVRQYFGTDKEVVVPEILNAHKIVKIAENAFSFSDMEKITLSKHITEIGDRAFGHCVNLKTIVVECEPPVLGDGVFEDIDEDFTVSVKNTTDVLDAYRAADKWCDIADHIWSHQ